MEGLKNSPLLTRRLVAISYSLLAASPLVIRRWFAPACSSIVEYFSTPPLPPDRIPTMCFFFCLKANTSWTTLKTFVYYLMGGFFFLFCILMVMGTFFSASKITKSDVYYETTMTTTASSYTTTGSNIVVFYFLCLFTLEITYLIRLFRQHVFNN